MFILQNTRHLFQAVFCLKLKFETFKHLQYKVTFLYDNATRLWNCRHAYPLVETLKSLYTYSGIIRVFNMSESQILWDTKDTISIN